MSKIVTSLEELDKIKGKELGEGREGICYYLNNSSLILKIYKEDKRPRELNGSNNISSYIAFPKDIFTDSNGNIIANTMSFLPGKKITDGFPEHIEISKIKEAYNRLLEEIKKFPNIYMSDLCLDNILYDENTNSFYIIDTKQWKNWDDSFGLNYARLDQNLSAALYENISWLSEYDFWKENQEFSSNYRRSKEADFIYFLKYLDEAIELISNYFDKEIVTFGDLSPKMKKKS